MDNSTCQRCLEEDESATHVLCDCEAIAHLRFHHLSQFFMEPSDFYNAPISKVLHFIQSVGLIKGTIDQRRSRCRGPDETHPSYLLTYLVGIKYTCVYIGSYSVWVSKHWYGLQGGCKSDIRYFRYLTVLLIFIVFMYILCLIYLCFHDAQGLRKHPPFILGN
jgi:hypothetical protein